MRASTVGAWLAVWTAAAGLGCGSSYDAMGAPAPAPCTLAGAAALTTPVVTLSDNAFSPACARVAAGTTVTFRNAGGVTHTVTADSGAFDHTANAGQEVTQAFASAGTVGIHCSLHPGMRMTLFVQ